MAITILGLGPGNPGQITREVWDLLAQIDELYLRTARHPTVAALPSHLALHSFDDLYETLEDFAAVYEAIADQIVELGQRPQGVFYAVPGHPLVGELSVQRILARAREAGLGVRLAEGLSFLEPVLTLLEIDAMAGLQVADATDLATAHHPPLDPDRPALIGQLYGRQLASDVKLTLMNAYPDDHPVTLVRAAGTDEASKTTVPLYELDRGQQVDHLTTLYVPPLPRVSGLPAFQETVARLRAPDGCPWDREQTHQSLRANLLEETYEVLAALDADDPEELVEELGDLLMQIVIHTQIATEEGTFKAADVIGRIDAKLKRRHPHVWAGVDVQGDPERVLSNWEQIKAKERADNGQEERSLLAGIPKTLPALAQAHEYDDRAARVGFDWPDEQGVIDKVREEMAELLAAATPEERLHEIGDLLFVVAVWARWLKISPEDALRAANRRFYERFSLVESQARQAGRSLREMSLQEMDVLWNEAKRQLSSGK